MNIFTVPTAVYCFSFFRQMYLSRFGQKRPPNALNVNVNVRQWFNRCQTRWFCTSLVLRRRDLLHRRGQRNRGRGTFSPRPCSWAVCRPFRRPDAGRKNGHRVAGTGRKVAGEVGPSPHTTPLKEVRTSKGGSFFHGAVTMDNAFVAP